MFLRCTIITHARCDRNELRAAQSSATSSSGSSSSSTASLTAVLAVSLLARALGLTAPFSAVSSSASSTSASASGSSSPSSSTSSSPSSSSSSGASSSSWSFASPASAVALVLRFLPGGGATGCQFTRTQEGASTYLAQRPRPRRLLHRFQELRLLNPRICDAMISWAGRLGQQLSIVHWRQAILTSSRDSIDYALATQLTDSMDRATRAHSLFLRLLLVAGKGNELLLSLGSALTGGHCDWVRGHGWVGRRKGKDGEQGTGEEGRGGWTG